MKKSLGRWDGKDRKGRDGMGREVGRQQGMARIGREVGRLKGMERIGRGEMGC